MDIKEMTKEKALNWANLQLDEACDDAQAMTDEAYDALTILVREAEEPKVIPRVSVATIIDVFEDFLEEKNVTIDNPDKNGDENEAIIYGEDFDILMSGIIGVLENSGFKVPNEY